MELAENKMGTLPIGKLLLSISFPIMISMLIQALYNIVDSYFVGKISEDAFTALSIAFPIQNLMIGIAVGTGVGMNAYLSRYLGEKKVDRATAAAENGIFLSLIYGILFFLLSFFLPKIYFHTQTTDHRIFQYGVDYLHIIMMLSMGIYMQIIMERMLQATGKSIYMMISQSAGAITNIILDPIMIFGYFGCPAMGVKGAAYATICGQCVGAVLSLLFHHFFNKEIKVRHIRPELKMIGKIYEVGIPSIIMVTINSVTIYALNKILAGFSSAAVASLGAFFKLQSFILMPIFGLNSGMIPIIAYNYGAHSQERIKKTIKISLFSAAAIMAMGTLVFQLFPSQLLEIFSASEEMMSIGIYTLRIISLCFIPAAVSIIGASVFQALGNGMLSLMCSALRQLILLLPFAYLFSLLGDVNKVWWAYPVAELGALIFVVYFMNTYVMQKIEYFSE